MQDDAVPQDQSGPLLRQHPQQQPPLVDHKRQHRVEKHAHRARARLLRRRRHVDTQRRRLERVTALLRARPARVRPQLAATVQHGPDRGRGAIHRVYRGLAQGARSRRVHSARTQLRRLLVHRLRHQVPAVCESTDSSRSVGLSRDTQPVAQARHANAPVDKRHSQGLALR